MKPSLLTAPALLLTLAACSGHISDPGRFPFVHVAVKDWAQRAALGVLYDLSNCRGVRQERDIIDGDIRREIMDTLATIILLAHRETTDEQ